eukprot:1822914-Rhodomonas_salina.1
MSRVSDSADHITTQGEPLTISALSATHLSHFRPLHAASNAEDRRKDTGHVPDCEIVGFLCLVSKCEDEMEGSTRRVDEDPLLRAMVKAPPLKSRSFPGRHTRTPHTAMRERREGGRLRRWMDGWMDGGRERRGRDAMRG